MRDSGYNWKVIDVQPLLSLGVSIGVSVGVKCGVPESGDSTPVRSASQPVSQSVSQQRRPQWSYVAFRSIRVGTGPGSGELLQSTGVAAAATRWNALALRRRRVSTTFAARSSRPTGQLTVVAGVVAVDRWFWRSPAVDEAAPTMADTSLAPRRWVNAMAATNDVAGTENTDAERQEKQRKVGARCHYRPCLRHQRLSVASLALKTGEGQRASPEPSTLCRWSRNYVEGVHTASSAPRPPRTHALFG